MRTGISVSLIEGAVVMPVVQILADMNKDGVYEVDITDHLLSIDYINQDLEIKNSGDALGHPCVNTASITMRNDDGYFSINNPSNIESFYTGTFRRGTRITIKMGFKDANGAPQTIEKFNGYISDMRFSNSSSGRTAIITMKDLAGILQRLPNPSHTPIGD